MTLSERVNKIFTEYAASLKAAKANHFRVSAIKKAAEVVLTVPLEALVASDSLKSIKGIGDELNVWIKEISATGKSESAEKLLQEYLNRGDVKPVKKEKSKAVRFYWAFEQGSTDENNEGWTDEERIKILGSADLRTVCYVIVPKKTWDEEGYWDDASKEYGAMVKAVPECFGEMAECIYEFIGTREEAERILNSLPQFEQNPMILNVGGEEQ